MNQAYADFLASKAIRAKRAGFHEIPQLPAAMRPFQRDITAWALKLGRSAIFAGTGLGKTIQQLAWAEAVVNREHRPVLILTPLAVAQQTVGEARKFGIQSVEYAKDQSEAKTSIVVTNYDRIEKFDLSLFVGIVLDESSIIKSHESQTRRLLIELCRGIPYRLCCTATPAPNDYVELGNHAEFLGVMTQKEMLSMWFVHEGSIRATSVRTHGQKPIAEWRLKGHAENDFWRWLSTWAVVVHHPREIGYDEPGYDLSPLTKHQITVTIDRPYGGELFPVQAKTLSERLGARKESVGERVKAAAEIVNAEADRPWLVWCHLNKESEMLVKAIPGAVEVKGADDREVKAERLLGFANGKYRVLVSKPSIAGFGMNFQRCSDMVFVGLNDSFEQLYQAIRRCWRFGQTKPVTAYMIASDREGDVVRNLRDKEDAAERMVAAMAEHMRDLTALAIRGNTVPTFTIHNQPMKVPVWLAA